MAATRSICLAYKIIRIGANSIIIDQKFQSKFTICSICANIFSIAKFNKWFLIFWHAILCALHLFDHSAGKICPLALKNLLFQFMITLEIIFNYFKIDAIIIFPFQFNVKKRESSNTIVVPSIEKVVLMEIFSKHFI